MPSFFSKKTRSQQAAGESPSGSTSLPSGRPLLPDDSYQLLLLQQQQQQQQSLQEDYSDRRFDLTRRPSEPFAAHRFHVGGSHSPHNVPYSELRYVQPDNQQQQQYRHPAHHNPSQLSLERPTISLVSPPQQQQQFTNQSDYQASPDRARNSIDQQHWSTSVHNNSSPDLLQDTSAATGGQKLQKKKKGFFSRNQSVASGSPPTATKQHSTGGKKERSLGRSASIKHSFGRESFVHPSAGSDYGRIVTTTTTGGQSGHSQSQSTLSQSQQFESETASLRPPTADTPVSPGRISQPHTPIDSTQRLGVDSTHSGWQHRRSESFESIPSQTSSRRPSIHQSLDQSVNDMATAQQTGTRPTDPQSQNPVRKDSVVYQQNTSGSSFKGDASQQDTQGRETPTSTQSEALDVAALIKRHEELQVKYQKVKRYYFEKDAQVTQLQNTVAHQRMAVSRTVLDDNEYTARFNRLDGAIKDLAFSIRKNWRTIPDWLHPFINEDAVSLGQKEMTGVGRAVLSRWVVEDVFNRYFHPGLERGFSERLKTVEMNLRRQQVQVFNEDDKENQVARISNWRRTTLDGLTDQIQSKSTQENMDQLVEYLVEKLSAMLQCDLQDPAPPELAHYTRMIVENAINIAEKIPQEARDIVVDYIVPGSLVSEINMKVETGLPPLTRPVAAAGRDDNNIATSGENDEMETDTKETAASQSDQSKNAAHIPQSREQRKKYPFGSLMSKKSSTPTQPQQSQNQGTTSSPEKTTNNKERDEQLQQQDKRGRVRFSTFMMVEVKGRGPNNVLIQAPVYTIE
ncbi:conserved hypothetical protein [Talaromyces stipitatus ATCC 10500]|uniref:Uncharacterized protein n=1 Tax=Talaromyces stipitatus (strain ATCC 10500 / CBS 375.48 / QM 6759 / NRRL 1006) TaxID=441959 RepID=B8LZ74_TALSN|nr:uncharacterized protein TSTA_083500 [Talaromyces stipitatus ATCC 10500]EED21118.1 conserved hypothetical protein [Talaromyces stipitatus ATCC 10500]